jgi:hypothetical protein
VDGGEAKRLLGDVADGGDPSADKAAEKRNPTLAAFVAIFLRDHVEAKRKVRTAEQYADQLNRLVLPVLGSRRLADIARADVAKLHMICAQRPIRRTACSPCCRSL